MGLRGMSARTILDIVEDEEGHLIDYEFAPGESLWFMTIASEDGDDFTLELPSPIADHGDEEE